MAKAQVHCDRNYLSTICGATPNHTLTRIASVIVVCDISGGYSQRRN
jgi:hypothetical protein